MCGSTSIATAMPKDGMVVEQAPPAKVAGCHGGDQPSWVPPSKDTGFDPKQTAPGPKWLPEPISMPRPQETATPTTTPATTPEPTLVQVPVDVAPGVRATLLLDNRDTSGTHPREVVLRSPNGDYVKIHGDPHVEIMRNGRVERFDVGYGAAGFTLPDGTQVSWDTNEDHMIRNLRVNGTIVNTFDGRDVIAHDTGVDASNLDRVAEQLRLRQGNAARPVGEEQALRDLAAAIDATPEAERPAVRAYLAAAHAQKQAQEAKDLRELGAMLDKVPAGEQKAVRDYLTAVHLENVARGRA